MRVATRLSGSRLNCPPSRFFYLQVYCEANGVSETIAFYSLAILNAASVFGALPLHSFES